jgi:hypothetical protein
LPNTDSYIEIIVATKKEEGFSLIVSLINFIFILEPKYSILKKKCKSFLYRRTVAPISIHGRYYYRSGGTKQELIGKAHTDHLFRKSSKTCDEVSEPTATLNDINNAFLKSYVQHTLMQAELEMWKAIKFIY